MEEIFVSLKIQNFEDIQISNYGRVKSSKGKILSTIFKNNCLNIDIRKRRNGKVIDRLTRSVPQLVYKYFSNNVPDCEFMVHCKDGNPYNCNIENLEISLGCPSKEQIEKYNSSVIACVKDILRHSDYFYYTKKGFDFENVVGQSYLYIWKYLSKYDVNKSFYTFCKRYVKVACLNEYKHWIKLGIPMSDIIC